MKDHCVSFSPRKDRFGQASSYELYDKKDSRPYLRHAMIYLPLPGNGKSYTKDAVLNFAIRFKSDRAGLGSAIDLSSYGPTKRTIYRMFPNKVGFHFPKKDIAMLLKGENKGSNEWKRKVDAISSSSFGPPIKQIHELFDYDDAESDEDIMFDFNDPPDTSVAKTHRDSRDAISPDTVMDTADFDPLMTTADGNTILDQPIHQEYAASAFGKSLLEPRQHEYCFPVSKSSSNEESCSIDACHKQLKEHGLTEKMEELAHAIIQEAIERELHSESTSAENEFNLRHSVSYKNRKVGLVSDSYVKLKHERKTNSGTEKKLHTDFVQREAKELEESYALRGLSDEDKRSVFQKLAENHMLI